MNYLFVAVQKEAERSEEFGSREEAREYFEKRFGEEATEKKEQGSGCHLEERTDLRCQPVFGETSLILRLVGIFRIGSRYRVIEERYYCSGWKGFGEDGILEVRKRIPKTVTANSIALEGCRESPEALTRFQKAVKKITAEAVKNFRATASMSV